MSSYRSDSDLGIHALRAVDRLSVRRWKLGRMLGVRYVTLRPALRDELAALKDELAKHNDGKDPGDNTPVFPTQKGGRTRPDNLRPRILAKAVERANKNLAAQKRVPLPEGLTPHKLRHTFASVLYALGEDPGVVMDEMGHTDPGLALRLYRHAMRRGDDEKAKLRALVEGPDQIHPPSVQTYVRNVLSTEART